MSPLPAHLRINFPKWWPEENCETCDKLEKIVAAQKKIIDVKTTLTSDMETLKNGFDKIREENGNIVNLVSGFIIWVQKVLDRRARLETVDEIIQLLGEVDPGPNPSQDFPESSK